MYNALIIDDNRQAANGISRMLELMGFHTTVVYGPRAAIVSIERQVPNVVFLDLHMPGVSGFDLLTYLRRDPRLERVPVVVVTSDDQPETAHRAISTGALATLIKPISVEALERALRKIGMLEKA